MARKILNHYEAPSEGQEEERKVHFPVLDVLERSLSAIRELDPELIQDWGPADRLEEGVTAVTPPDDDTTFEQLKETIRENGQQVPILVRPSKQSPGQFEVIYGRRRLRACRELGTRVKANVQEMDDATALMAKGLENANRRGLSFYEKALFAEQIIKEGNTAAKAGEAIGVTRTAVMNLTRITKAVPRGVGIMIDLPPVPTAQVAQAGRGF
ncbi:ParB/RepB/Spo0J family partition protein [Leisingera sp. M658]|uniref:ParB/RepB/Spo0J family partition protein n=1 Tax=Leisingera sp. M658 TaxID=2867015 RepID=UPI0021A370A1|nr:ParB/RepB/Spo0J family partition protein [Leisingera sp. M658]UWQ77384.1 ParB/RepB/Spo0J family partition protein [Leisingera sp. M658]